MASTTGPVSSPTTEPQEATGDAPGTLFSAGGTGGVGSGANGERARFEEALRACSGEALREDAADESAV